MRVVAGKYRGRHFDVPRTFKARPTTDFAKENLFNVLRRLVDFSEVRALDLFGGTGSITLEMLSRGARSVTCVEKDFRHAALIRSFLRTLGDANATVLCTDALRFIAKATETYDFAFADPPYALPELPELPERVLGGSLVKPGGIFVLEHGKEHDFSQHPLFTEHRAYGSVNFSIFTQH